MKRLVVNGERIPEETEKFREIFGDSPVAVAVSPHLNFREAVADFSAWGKGGICFITAKIKEPPETEEPFACELVALPEETEILPGESGSFRMEGNGWDLSVSTENCACTEGDGVLVKIPGKVRSHRIWEPFGRRGVVTAVEGNAITEVNDLPVFEFLAEELGLFNQETLSFYGLFFPESSEMKPVLLKGGKVEVEGVKEGEVFTVSKFSLHNFRKAAFILAKTQPLTPAFCDQRVLAHLQEEEISELIPHPVWFVRGVKVNGLTHSFHVVWVEP